MSIDVTIDVTIAVATFGDRAWLDLALSRAIPSAKQQAVPVVHAHGRTLADARNVALREVRSEWVIHLDADDELAPGYVEAMGRAHADLRAPAVSYVRGGRPRPARVPRVAGHQHDCWGDCLEQGNFVAVGAAVRTEIVRVVGGWREEPVYEDWSLFLRCWRAGATVESVPGAEYIAHVRPESRNRGTPRELKERTHHEIAVANA